MVVSVDGWLGIQNMTGHPSYYLCPVFPARVKKERVGKNKIGALSILKSECLALVGLRFFSFCEGRVFDGDQQTLKVFTI